MARDRKPSYLRQAFINVYNLSLFSGALAASALSGHYVLGAAVAGAEALWLAIGPGLPPFRRAADRRSRIRRQEQERYRLKQLSKNLPEREWARARALDVLRSEIERDMQNNPSFQVVLFQVELDKLGQLYSSFISLAASCSQAEIYLSNADSKELERQIDIHRNLEKTLGDAQARELAKKNALVLERRLASLQDIRNFLARARGQMTLIENSVRLLRDQVLTMASPDQLGDQLDDLLSGVEGIQATAREQDFSRIDGSVLPEADAGPAVARERS
jgi:hypothetical protein